jgi:hypothetical protein
MTLTRLSASKIGRLCLLEQSNAATGEPETYRMLSNNKGGCLHMTDTAQGLLVPDRNPLGYFLLRTLTRWLAN